jgi:hypothetical protein
VAAAAAVAMKKRLLWNVHGSDCHLVQDPGQVCEDEIESVEQTFGAITNLFVFRE